jgi:Zn-dependent M28 family amino/carboxypeptidase
LIELARAFTKLPTKRSILFLAVTAEERGLLGSAHYGANPLYPLIKTVACINTDSMNVNGKTKDITVVGLGNSTLDDYVKAAATKQGRTVKPDPEPEKGYFYRSDHFNFAKYGVPALYTDPGIDYIGKPANFGEESRKKYTSEDYHKPSDEIKPELILEVGYEVANAGEIPKWREGNEFKARRDKMLAEAGSK